MSLEAGTAGIDQKTYTRMLDGPSYNRRKYIENHVKLQQEALAMLQKEGKSIDARQLHQKMVELENKNA